MVAIRFCQVHIKLISHLIIKKDDIWRAEDLKGPLPQNKKMASRASVLALAHF